MNVRDWRQLPAEALAPLYASERARALRSLHWDFTTIWHEVEHARTTWGLPGLVACDPAGRIHGMTFYVAEGDRLDVGGIVSDDVRATDALLDGVLGTAAAVEGCVVRMLVFDGAVALRSALKTRRFQVEPHLYLSRTLRTPTRTAAGLAEGPRPCFTAWEERDIAGAAALLRRAYEPSAGTLFAAHNDPAEWERYVSNLVAHPGCGMLDASATAVLRDGSELRGLAMITEIAPQVAHLAQLAVDPASRGQRLGRALLDEACLRLAARGYRLLTLLVAEGNRAARALYGSAGFDQDATFLGARLEAFRRGSSWSPS